MRHRYISLKSPCLFWLFLLLLCSTVLPQKKSIGGHDLDGFEKGLEQGRIDQIERPLLDYAIANPNDTKALDLLARVRVVQGRPKEAAALYQRVLALDPASASAKVGAGRIAYAQGQKEDAVQLLNSIEQTSSLSLSTRFDLATALFMIGELPQALAVVEGLPANIKNTEALPLLAAIYLESGRKNDLVSLIPLMESSSPTRPVWAVQSAEVLQNAGMNDDAKALLRLALAKSPNDLNLLLYLGKLEVILRDFSQARVDLKRASELYPRSAEVLSMQSRLEIAMGNTTEALELLIRARQLAPNAVAILADLVLVAIRNGKSQVAVDAAKDLVSMNPENVEYLYLLGAAALQNGNLGLAQANLERFAQKQPTDSRGCLALGLTYAAQSDKIETARQQLNHCLEIDPANFEAKYQLGLSYKAQGDNQKAIQFFEDVIKRVPNYTLALRDLGTLYLQTGEDVKARGLLEQAVSLNPQDADIHFQLSRLYNQIGEPTLAKQHLELFQKLRNQGGKSTQ
jgi:Uncharacterized enzyme of heme biosynthesis